jgi:hypothetical protein
MTNAFPGFMQLARVSQPQLITDGQANLTALEFGHDKPSNALLIQAYIPAHSDIRLGLAFFQTLVVVGFDLDEGSKNVLILVCILVAKEDWLGFIINAWLRQIFQSRL